MNDFITNGTEIKQRIISEINNASVNIFVAMAYFTDRDIAKALIAAKNRNVLIDLILSSNAQNETVKLMLSGAEISVHSFEVGDSRGIMHHKFCLIDNNISINGSYNYSFNASTNNVENITVSDDPTIYSQFFTEFERLKHNIDNQIAINKSDSTQKTPKQIEPQNIQHKSFIEDFSQQLHNLVFSATEINLEIQKEKGYKVSKESKGNLDRFFTEVDDIHVNIRNLASDDGLGSKKDALVSNIGIAYESTKVKIESGKENEISIEKRRNDIEKKQISEKMIELEQDISILELGNNNTGEKGLLQINKEIEKKTLEKKTLEQLFIPKFLNKGTILAMIVLVIIIFFLFVYFASAVYKILIESNMLENSKQRPPIVDLNAIKEMNDKGVIYLIFAILFFIIPVLITNLKMLGIRKAISEVLYWVGLVIFDIAVALFIFNNNEKMEKFMVGESEKYTFKYLELLTEFEFYLIFMFGAFPLIGAHFLIDYLRNEYNKPQNNNRNIKILESELIDLNADKKELNKKIEDKALVIQELKDSVQKLESDANESLTKVENKYSSFLIQATSVFDDYSTRIKSGKIFTDEILKEMVYAFKSGFITYLPEYYSPEEVTKRVKEIESNIQE